MSTTVYVLRAFGGVLAITVTPPPVPTQFIKTTLVSFSGQSTLKTFNGKTTLVSFSGKTTLIS